MAAPYSLHPHLYTNKTSKISAVQFISSLPYLQANHRLLILGPPSATPQAGKNQTGQDNPCVFVGIRNHNLRDQSLVKRLPPYYSQPLENVRCVNIILMV